MIRLYSCKNRPFTWRVPFDLHHTDNQLMKQDTPPASSTANISTANRCIKTEIPHPADIELCQSLDQHEPRGFGGQTTVVWDRAHDVHIFDRHGNQWIDFTSGILVANAGHGTTESINALQQVVGSPLHHTYIFANTYRADLVAYLMDYCAPDYLDKVALLTTGSEANECALKVCRNYAHTVSAGFKKDLILSMDGAYHGRTMGSQMAGGSPHLKQWIRNPDPGLVNISSPDPFSDGHQAFDVFLRELEEKKIDPNHIAGILIETYPGWKASLHPKAYIQSIRRFCDQYGILLIFDEVQAGFGRCGKMWGFEHYDVTADLIVCGKGISSGLPVSAVIGHSKWMDLFSPGTLTSTHLGNPLGCAAALANLKKIVEHNLADNAAKLEDTMISWLLSQKQHYQDKIGHTAATGLVGVIELLDEDAAPNAKAAGAVVDSAISNGGNDDSTGRKWGGNTKNMPALVYFRTPGC